MRIGESRFGESLVPSPFGLVLALLLALGGCSGGSSGGGVAIAPSGTLDSTNAVAVAAEVLDKHAPTPLWISVITRQYERAYTLRPLAGVPLPCSGGGTVMLNETADSLTLVYSGCIEGGATGDGIIAFVSIVGNLFADPSACPGTLSFTVTFNNWVVDDTTDVRSINDTFDFSTSVDDQDLNTTCETVAHDISSSSFSSSRELNEDTGDDTRSGSGTMDSVAAGGTVGVMTTAPIFSNTADAFPSAGTLSITADTAVTTVTINSNVAVDPMAVTISLDADGVPGPDPGFPQDFSWDALAAL